MNDKQDIFIKTCRSIARPLESEGFGLDPAGKSLERKRDAWEDVVFFGSSFSPDGNSDSIFLEVRAAVSDDKLGEWRKTGRSPFSRNGFFGAALIDNLFNPASGRGRYDIGAESEREGIVSSIQTLLTEDVLRFFEIAHDPDRVIQALENGPVPAFNDPINLIEYFLSYQKPDLVERYIKSLSTQWPDFAGYLKDYSARKNEMAENIEMNFTDAYGMEERVAAGKAARVMFHYKL